MLKKSKKALKVLYVYGSRAFLKKVLQWVSCKINKLAEKYPFSESLLNNKKTVQDLIYQKFINSEPIQSVIVKRKALRLNLVTDSLHKDSLFGGVGTALVIASQLAIKNNMPLRIITREIEANPKDFFRFLKLMKLPLPEVSFYSDSFRNVSRILSPSRLEVSEHDVFISTSWWSTKSIKEINLRQTQFYLLQEFEQFFYPHSDEKILSEEVLKDPNVRYIINSNSLFEYYSSMGYRNVIQNGVHFEPVFPRHLYGPHEHTFKPKNRYKLFFYGRPSHPRNLFYTGLSILDEALLLRIIKSEEWEINIVGSSLPKFKFSSGIEPVIINQMDWSQYSNFIKSVDLGICLMYTPHPSYPPLDVAASGGVVLTNQFSNKLSLPYSQNIVCESLEQGQMLKGLKKALDIAMNPDVRKKNFQGNQINNEWKSMLDPVNAFFEKNL